MSKRKSSPAASSRRPKRAKRTSSRGRASESPQGRAHGADGQKSALTINRRSIFPCVSVPPFRLRGQRPSPRGWVRNPLSIRALDVQKFFTRDLEPQKTAIKSVAEIRN
jgi:hypothetical protein